MKQQTILTLLLAVPLLSARNFTIDSKDAFKIVMFSDLFIDNDATNYAFTMQLFQNVIDAESPIDLVVLAGDTVNPDLEGEFFDRFEDAIVYFKMKGIPWVSTGGEDRPGNDITRDYMYQQDQLIGKDEDLSYTGRYNPDPSYGPYT